MGDDRDLIVGALTAIGVEQGVLFLRYRRAVGEGNTTVAGFRAWKHALRQQPRVSPRRAVLGVVGVPVFYLLANIPHLPVVIGVVFGLLVVLSLLYAVVNLAHRNPPLGPPRAANDAQTHTKTGQVVTSDDWEKKMASFTDAVEDYGREKT